MAAGTIPGMPADRRNRTHTSGAKRPATLASVSLALAAQAREPITARSAAWVGPEFLAPAVPRLVAHQAGKSDAGVDAGSSASGVPAQAAAVAWDAATAAGPIQRASVANISSSLIGLAM